MKSPEYLIISNVTKNSTVCSAARLADTFGVRLCGLLGRKELAPEAGLLIMPSSGVHTMGMRFSIDVIALDKHLRVLGVWEDVAPWRFRGLGVRTHSVLELKSGRARQSRISAGDQLKMRRSAAAWAA